MRKLGYARVSNQFQEKALATQTSILLDADRCDEVYSEVTTKPVGEREGLNRLLSSAKEGDLVVVFSLDRLSRDKKEVIEFIDSLHNKGIFFRGENFDTSTFEGVMIYQQMKEEFLNEG